MTKLPEGVAAPRHVAVIMDGNGRWAKRRGMPRRLGHSAGSDAFKRNAEWLDSIGVEYMTVYAFSTENWSRPADEVDAILSLLRRYMRDACGELIEKNMRLRFIGDLAALPEDIRDMAATLHELSKKTTGMQVNIALNYGGRAELVRAVNEVVRSRPHGEVTEDDFASHLYTAGIPDPELLIRPGAERRLSNFLLWQLSYSEIYFCDVLWPDFGEKDFIEAFRWFSSRERRFGGIGGEQ